MLCKACFRFSPHWGIGLGGGVSQGIYMFFTCFFDIRVLAAHWGGGGGVSQGIGTQPAHAVFHSGAAQKAKFSKLVFLILRPPKMTIHAM